MRGAEIVFLVPLLLGYLLSGRFFVCFAGIAPSQ